MPNASAAPRTVFGSAVAMTRRGVHVEERVGLGIAAVLARKGVDGGRIGAALGTMLPDGAMCFGTPALTFVGKGPAAWLAIGENASPDWTLRLAERLNGLASVSDHSGGYTILRLSGLRARTLLSRGAHIDLHPTVFRAGAAAKALIGHIDVLFWQAGEADIFDIAVSRSYVASFGHWVDATVATLAE